MEVRLLARTTRSVAPTDAGSELLAHLRPALADIRQALDKVTGLRDKPAGRVRLLVSPIASTLVLAPKLDAFARDYPTSSSMSPRQAKCAWIWSRDTSTPASNSRSSYSPT